MQQAPALQSGVAGIGQQIDKLKAEVAAVNWWHSIDLGHGVVTPGRGGSPEALQRLNIPADLTGKTVLDIGTWDGHFAFEAERRGAARVVAIDIHRKKGFEVAHRALNSRVEFHQKDVRELGPDDFGMFDIVTYPGVIYHLPDPMESLVRVFSVTRELAIIETDSSLNHVPYPAAEFRGEREGLSSDAPNWWIFNEACLLEMARVAGFSRVKTAWGPGVPGSHTPLRKWLWSAFPKRFPRPFHARLVIHAWR